MRRSVMSQVGRMLREAVLAGRDSMRTGIPIDEVTDMRAERAEHVRVQAHEAAEIYTAANLRRIETGNPEDDDRATLALMNLRRVGRRDLIKGSAAALALLALTRSRKAEAKGGSAPTIAIIGGGLAGLRTAHYLWTQYGWKSTIYEANSDVGGRCETNRNYFANNTIAEMHGEFVSTEHASMFNLINLFKLGTDDANAYPTGTNNTYWCNGARYTQAMLNADWTTWAWSFFNSQVKAVPWPQRYNSYTALAHTYDQMTVPDWINKYQQGGTASQFGQLCLANNRSEYGGEPTDQSALSHMFMLGYDDSITKGRGYQPKASPVLAGTNERWHITQGSDAVVTGMINALPAGTVQLNQQLTAVVANSNGTYTLTLQSGTNTTTTTVQSVVLALPFKVLRNVDLSKAGLSTLKMTAINGLGMGTSGKVVLECNGAPWHSAGYQGTMYQNAGMFSCGWQMPQSAALGGYNSTTALWTSFPSGNESLNIIAKYGVNLHEGVPPAALVTDTLAAAEAILPGITASCTGKAWYHFGYNDPFVQGGYSYYRVGQYTSFSGYEQVAEGHIHFAGEHTSTDFQGFMEGAVTSGERVAQEIKASGA